MQNAKGSFSTDCSENGPEFIKQQIILLSILHLKIGSHLQKINKSEPALKCRYVHTYTTSTIQRECFNKLLFFFFFLSGTYSFCCLNDCGLFYLNHPAQ